MAYPTLLIIDDEPQIRRAVRHAVERDVTTVVEAETGRTGIDLAASQHPDVIILDLGLPDTTGEDVCREIRGWSSVPIIVLSARHTDQEKVRLLDAGADDYITKPFSSDELRARTRAQLRRAKLSPRDESKAITVDGLVIDLTKRSVSRDGQEIRLTPIEWALLRAFVSTRGRTLTHTQLFRMVWTRGEGDPQQNLRVHVANLRRKIERESLRPRLIITEPGVGYRFADPPREPGV
jgi:two-component system KDP operon response regulator KdpE